MGYFVDHLVAATGAPTARDVTDVLADAVNVKDYGAKGNGIDNDGAAIQTALDVAYGPASAPNSNVGLNRLVVLPNGEYRIDQQLFLNHVAGARLRGMGQKQTRLRYVGPNSGLPGGGEAGPLTSLLTLRTVTYSEVAGITFDCTGSNAAVGVQLMNAPGINNDGTGIAWRDCGFIGAHTGANTGDGFLATGNGTGATGSEQLFEGCLFDGNDRGVIVSGYNVLNYTFLRCAFKNGIQGIGVPSGAINLVLGCWFENNSQIDVHVKQNECPTIIGGYSTSPNVCLIGPGAIMSFYHNPSSVGGIWNGLVGLDQDRAIIAIDGCLCGANSKLIGGPVDHIAYVRGTSFLNAAPIDCGFTTAVTISNASPAVIGWPSHGRVFKTGVAFKTTGALPTGLLPGVIYYIRSILNTNSFTVSATPNGAAINTSSDGSGTHSVSSNVRELI